MKKLSILFLFLVTTLIGFSQQQVSYTLLEDNPDKVKKLFIGAPFLVVDLCGDDVFMGLGLEARYNLNHKMFFEAYYGGLAYLHNESFSENPNIKKPNKFDATYSFVFASTDKLKDHTIRLGERGNYVYTVEDIEGPRRRNFLVRGGVLNYNGLGMPDRKVSILSMSAGVGAMSYSNIKINADGWGICKNGLYMNYYFDVLFAPVIKTADAKANTASLGYRFGFDFMKNINKGVSIYARSEFGKRPGLADNKFYVYLSSGIAINIL